VISEAHLVPAPGGGSEPIGARIIELPADTEHFTSRDGRVRFTAYVPPGSIEKGRRLVTTGGNGRTVACATCHGPNLRGTGVIPPIVGRFPTYVLRQLFDIKAGSRHGGYNELMKPTVEKLTLDDMIALAAYTSSLKP